MPQFFRDATERLVYLGPEPDRWREDSEYALKQSQEPDHYVKLEVLGAGFEFPRGRYEFFAELERRRAEAVQAGRPADQLLPENVGLQPYITIELYERLKVAFRQYRMLSREGGRTDLVEGNAILYAGWLGHYVADGAQPQHTSVHYDEWGEPNPSGYSGPGLHARFEGDYVRRNIRAATFSGRVRAPAHLADPFADYLRYLRQSHELVEEVFRIDKAGGFDGAGSAEALEFTAARLASASQMLLDLWYTAWEDSR